MNKDSSKTKHGKYTVALSIVLVLIVCAALFVFVIRPAYVQKKSYELYGGINDELKDSELFEDMQSGKSFCFLGDSITEGSTIEIQWYRPLQSYIKGDYVRFSHGGWTVKDLIVNSDRIPVADVYVIAIGTNDVGAFESDWCAATPDVFTDRLDQVSQILKAISPDAKQYYITPWMLVDHGAEMDERGKQFREAEIKWCKETGYVCIDPAPVMLSVFEREGAKKFMRDDGIHPNALNGISLYAYAVLQAAHDGLSSSAI